MRKIATLTVVLALAAAACGDDDTTSTTASGTTAATSTSIATTTTVAATTTVDATAARVTAAMEYAGTYSGEWNNTTFGSSGASTCRSRSMPPPRQSN